MIPKPFTDFIHRPRFAGAPHGRGALVGLMSGVFFSVLIHAGALGRLRLWIKKSNPSIVAELEFSLAPTPALAPNAGGGRGREGQEWFLPPERKRALPPPPPSKEKIEEPALPPVTEEEAAPCEEPCTEGDGSGGGGTGDGSGLYVPVSATSRKPKWVDHFITPNDYPLLARRGGQDGRVMLQLFIDDKGVVQDAILLQGAYDLLNEVALRKVKSAKFTPAYDEEGRPVNCKVVLPLRFELK